MQDPYKASDWVQTGDFRVPLKGEWFVTDRLTLSDVQGRLGPKIMRASPDFPSDRRCIVVPKEKYVNPDTPPESPKIGFEVNTDIVLHFRGQEFHNLTRAELVDLEQALDGYWHALEMAR